MGYSNVLGSVLRRREEVEVEEKSVFDWEERIRLLGKLIQNQLSFEQLPKTVRSYHVWVGLGDGLTHLSNISKHIVILMDKDTLFIFFCSKSLLLK